MRRSPPPRRGAPTRRRPAGRTAPARPRSAPARRAVGNPESALLAPPHHPVRRGEPERRATGEHDRVEAVDDAFGRRADRTRASPARRPAPRPTRPCPRGTGRPCSRCGRSGSRPVPDADAGDVGDHSSSPRVRARHPRADAAHDLVGDRVEPVGPLRCGHALVALLTEEHDLVADVHGRRRRSRPSADPWSRCRRSAVVARR